MTGITDDVDALRCFTLIDQLQYCRMQMHMVADHFAAHLLIGQGRRQNTRFSVMEAAHSIKQMRCLGGTGFDRFLGFIVRSIGMTHGYDQSLIDRMVDQFNGSLRFRGDGENLQ